MKDNNINLNEIFTNITDNDVNKKNNRQVDNAIIEEKEKKRLEQYEQVCSEFLKRAEAIQAKRRTLEINQDDKNSDNV